MTAPRTLPADQIPEVRDIAEAAVDEFRFSQRFACGHSPVPVVYLCAAHPRLGVKCRRCMAEHLLRHAEAFEHSCDLCGAVVDLIHGMTFCWEAIHFEVRTTRRKRLALWGPINVVGIGVCQPCLAESEMERCPTCFAEVSQGRCWGCGRT